MENLTEHLVQVPVRPSAAAAPRVGVHVGGPHRTRGPAGHCDIPYRP